MKAPRAEVPNLNGGLTPNLPLQRGAPLLDILRRRVQLQRGKADRGGAKHGCRKVEGIDAGNVGIALRRLWKDIWNVMALVAPSVHVNGCIEDAVGSTPD